MSFLKRFDFFPKFTVDNISKPTLLGSLLSITAITIIIYLMYSEFYEFINPTIVKETIIWTDPDQDSKLAINLQMHFFHMPCGILSVDQEDDLGNHNTDIHVTLIKHRYTNNHTVITESINHEPDEIARAIDEDEQCQISGHIDINKIPGNIHISNHGFSSQWEHLKVERKEIYPHLTLSHETQILNFGDYVKDHHILRRFGISEHTDFNRKKLPKLFTEKRKNFNYFLKIIPYIFIDEERDNDRTIAYQYSLNFKDSPFIEKVHEMHIVQLSYEFSPVAMRITRKYKGYSHFIAHICTIIGGIFVIFGLVNKAFLACCYDEKN